VRAELVLVPPADEHCYCVGTPDGTSIVDGDNYTRFCKDVSRNIIPHDVHNLSCMGHTLGFSAVVEPLLDFVLSVV